MLEHTVLNERDLPSNREGIERVTPVTRKVFNEATLKNETELIM